MTEYSSVRFIEAIRVDDFCAGSDVTSTTAMSSYNMSLICRMRT